MPNRCKWDSYLVQKLGNWHPGVPVPKADQACNQSYKEHLEDWVLFDLGETSEGTRPDSRGFDEKCPQYAAEYT